jgi:hypothetical protein
VTSSGYGEHSKHKATSNAYRNNPIWDKKSMASSTVEKMPKTVESYKKLAQGDLELIEAQAAEIANLTCKLNKRDQKIASLKGRISKLNMALAAKKKEKAVFIDNKQMLERLSNAEDYKQ